MTAFDKTWWLEHGATYRSEFPGGPAYEAQEAALLQVLHGLTRVNNVLEIGCGFGRITKLVREDVGPNIKYTATDVSPDAIAVAEQYLGETGKAINFGVFDLDTVGYAPEEADLVIAAEVLMHRTPDEVIDDVELLASMAKRYIINIDWYEPKGGHAEGCYQHDYATLFAAYGEVHRIEIPEARQAIWITKVD